MSAVTIPIPPTPRHGKDRRAGRPLRQHKRVRAIERELAQMLDQALAREAWRASRSQERTTS